MSSDQLADALDKLNNRLSQATSSTGTGSGGGSGSGSGSQYLKDVRGLVLQLDEQVLITAYIAGGAATISSLCIDTIVKTKITPPLYTGLKGTLSGLLYLTGASSVVGEIDLATVPFGSSSGSMTGSNTSVGTTVGWLTVNSKGYLFGDGSLEDQETVYFTASITPPMPLAIGQTYGYQLSHNISGTSNITSFAVDDSVLPNIQYLSCSVTSGPGIIPGAVVLSGVYAYSTAAHLEISVYVTNAISSHYRWPEGLALLQTNVCQDLPEAAGSNRDVSSYTPGSAHTITFCPTISQNAYAESLSIHCIGFNAIGNQSLFDETVRFRFDAISLPAADQVTSGTGIYPQIPGVDFGLPYDHTVSLIDVPELQFVSGKYRFPFPVDYTGVSPGTNPDYSNVGTSYPTRFATFHSSITDCISNASICIHGITGDGWGNGMSTGNFILQLRVTDGDDVDTGWLDANTFYAGPCSNGGNSGYNDDGWACLLSNGTSDRVKNITFGRHVHGDCYIRIGFDVSEIQAEMTDTIDRSKSFTHISLSYSTGDFGQGYDSRIARSLGTQLAFESDNIFAAYFAGRSPPQLATRVCKAPPVFLPIRNVLLTVGESIYLGVFSNGFLISIDSLTVNARGIEVGSVFFQLSHVRGISDNNARRSDDGNDRNDIWRWQRDSGRHCNIVRFRTDRRHRRV